MPSTTTRSKVTHTLRALRHRNYRLFFFGQGISLVGTWLQQTALPYLSYKTNESAMELGMAMFLTQVPHLFLSPFAGVLGDRFNRKKLVLITQTLAMLQAFVLAWLTLSDQVAMWHIYALCLLLGCIAAFDLPVRQAMMFDLIDTKHDIGNAVALNSTLVNLARVVGPAIAGVLIGLSKGHTGICFLLNGVSFIAVLISLVMIRIPPTAKPAQHEPVLHALHEGFRYTFQIPPHRLVLMLVAISSITAMSFTVLMPVYADHISHDDPHTFGILMAAGGLGALMGSIHLAAQPSPQGLARLIPIGAAISAVSMLLFAATTHLWPCAFFRMTASAGVLIQLAASNTILHLLAGDRLRSRVMAIYSMAFVGMAPFGSILGTTLAHHFGTRISVLISGAITCLAAAYFAVRLPAISSKLENHPH